MPSPILAALEAEVTEATTVMASATARIEGFVGRIQAAVDAALVNGFTEAELAPVQAEVDALHASAEILAAAVIANT